MSGIKIPVSADISGIKTSLQELTKEAEKVSSALSNKRPEIDTSRAMEALKRLWAEANRLEQKLQKPGKIDLGVAEASEQLVRAREEAERLAEALSTAGTVNPAYRRATEEARQLESAISRVVSQQRQLSDLFRQASTGVVGAFSPGAASAINAGVIAGGWGAGLKAAGATAAIYGAVRGAQAVSGGMDSAIQEAYSTSDLRGATGALVSEFRALAESARSASIGIGTTTGEFLQAEKTIARIGGISDTVALSATTRNAVSLARELGLDPGMGASVFGNQIRFRGMGEDETSQRKFAGILADVLSRTGFGKADEVLTAVTNFTAIAARSAFTDPNTAGYASLLMALSGKDSPFHGDVSGASSLINRADAAFRGGSGGMAGDAFLLGVIQNAVGRDFSAVDIKYLREQGIMGTLESALGPDSLLYKTSDPAKQRQLAAQLARARANGTANTPFFDLVNQALAAQIGDTGLRADAGSNLFGVGNAEYRAIMLEASKHGGMGGLSQKLAARGISMEGMSVASILNSAKLLDADDAALRNERKRILKSGKLSDEDSALLSGATTTEELRDALLKVSKDDVIKDQGQQTRDAIAGIQNAITEMSGKLVGTTTAIKEAVLAAAGVTPEKFAKWQAEHGTGVADAQARIDGRALEIHNLRAIKLPITSTLAKHGIMQGTYEAQRRRLKELEDADAADRAIIKSAEEKAMAQAQKSPRLMELKATQVTPSEAAAIRSAAKKYGVPENWFYKALALENSGANAVSPKGARGRFQLMPGNLRPGEDPTTVEGSVDAVGRVFRDAVKLYGPDEDAIFAYYNGGKRAGDAVHAGKPAPFKETRNYLDRAHKIDDPLPAEHRSRTGADKLGSLNINGQFTLIDTQGNQRAEPVTISHQYSLPHAGLA